MERGDSPTAGRGRWTRLALGLLSVVAGCTPAGRTPRQAPSVVLISIDTLRADRLSLYGYERPTTPNLERLAREGVIFETFYYPGGGTLPSHVTMLTSLSVATHDVTPASERVLEDERTTLAEQLQERGYDTAAFVDAGWVRSRFGFGQGFDVYDDEGGHFERILPKAPRRLALRASSERSDEQPFNRPRTTFRQTGHIDALRRAPIFEQGTMTGRRLVPFSVDPAYAIDIDTQERWAFAEWLLEHAGLGIERPRVAARYA